MAAHKMLQVTNRPGRASAAEEFVKSSEDCFKSFESIVVEQAQFNLATQTEADTRARLITKVLRDALDWPEPNISREEYANPGFMDYVLSLQRRVLVVEAKKTGDSFSVPLDVSTSASFTLSGILRTVKNLNDYINQVLTYCFNNGIEYACVTNGLQWVVFRAVRTDGIHVGQGRVIVFKSLEDIKTRFAEFWALLSKQGVENNSLVRAFQPSESAAFQYKRNPGNPGDRRESGGQESGGNPGDRRDVPLNFRDTFNFIPVTLSAQNRPSTTQYC
jgi:predicted type IV restriction endonuclease